MRSVESSCQGRIITINGEIKCQPKENSHNHVLDSCKIKFEMAVNKIKGTAFILEILHMILSEGTTQLEPVAIPSVHLLKHTIRCVETRN